MNKQIKKGTSGGVQQKSERKAPQSKSDAIAKGAKTASDITKAVKTAIEIGTMIAKNSPEEFTKYGAPSTNLTFSVRKGSNRDSVETIGITAKIAQSIPGDVDGDGITARDQIKSVNARAYADSINRLYAQLRASNSGAVNYSAIELAKYIEAYRGVGLMLSFARTLIASTNTFTPYEVLSPVGLFAVVSGLGSDKLLDEYHLTIQARANLIDKFNVLNDQFAITIPKFPELGVIKRDIYHTSNVFVDDPDFKRSYLYHLPQYTMVFNAEGELNDVDWFADASTMTGYVSTVLSFIELALGQLVLSTPTNRIAGDLLKAFGDAALFKVVPTLHEEDSVEFVYNELMMRQFQNAVTGGTPSTTSVVLEDLATPYKVYPFVALAKGSSTVNINREIPVTINSDEEDVSAGEAMELCQYATPIKLLAKAVQENAFYSIMHTSTLTYVSMNIVYASNNDVGVLVGTYKSVFNVNDAVGEGFYFLQSLISQFYRAMTYGYIDDITSTNGGGIVRIGDLDNYAYLYSGQKKVLNDLSTLSLYKTVDIARQANFKPANKFNKR